jgi:hypothetical protein
MGMYQQKFTSRPVKCVKSERRFSELVIKEPCDYRDYTGCA